jgi:hypothetical protein
MIKERFPEDEIISEERHNRFTDKRYRWIIDPLDGRQTMPMAIHSLYLHSLTRLWCGYDRCVV